MDADQTEIKPPLSGVHGLAMKPFFACLFCDFMTYSTEHLEQHTMTIHHEMLHKYGKNVLIPVPELEYPHRYAKPANASVREEPGKMNVLQNCHNAHQKLEPEDLSVPQNITKILKQEPEDLSPKQSSGAIGRRKECDFSNLWHESHRKGQMYMSHGSPSKSKVGIHLIKPTMKSKDRQTDRTQNLMRTGKGYLHKSVTQSSPGCHNNVDADGAKTSFICNDDRLGHDANLCYHTSRSPLPGDKSNHHANDREGKFYSHRNHLTHNHCQNSLTGDNSFKCDQCDKSFRQHNSLVRHIKIHTGEKSFKCDLCDRSFYRKCILVRHRSTHTGEKLSRDNSFKCDQCEKSFRQHNSLVRHIKIHTGEKSFKCDLCDRSFYRKCMLVRHKSTHTGEKPFKCNECGRCFNRNCMLIRHMRTHTGERPFTCNVCNKRFVQNGNLLIHMRTHTGEKPFKCNECGTSFVQSGDLIRHNMRTHTGEKPFKCNDCGKGFVQNSDLVRHMRTHTGERPFKCHECNKGFDRNAKLIHHMKIHTDET